MSTNRQLLPYFVLALFFGQLLPSPSYAATPTGLTYVEMMRESEGLSLQMLNGDFASVEDTIQSHIENKTRTATGDLAIIPILDLLFETKTHLYENLVNDNARNKRDSSPAGLLKAVFYYTYAWQARGERYIDKTARDALSLYVERLKKSHREFERILQIDQSSLVANYYLFRLAKEVNTRAETAERHFIAADRQAPYFLSLYLAKIDFLAPKWGGSEQELFAFVESVAWNNDPKSNMPHLIPAAYNSVCGQYGGRKSYFSRPEVWQVIERAYQILMKRYPNAAFFKIRYARDLISAGKKDQALELIKQANRIEPDHPEVKKYVSRYVDELYQKGGLSSQSNKTAAEYLHLKEQAKSAYKAKHWKEAEELYSRLVTIQVSDAHSWYFLGFLQHKRGDYVNAIESFNHAIEINPRKAAYYTYRCHSKMLNQQLQAGIDDCTKAIALDSREKHAYLNRAKAFQIMGKVKEAQEDLRIANSLP